MVDIVNTVDEVNNLTYYSLWSVATSIFLSTTYNRGEK